MMTSTLSAIRNHCHPSMHARNINKKLRPFLFFPEFCLFFFFHVFKMFVDLKVADKYPSQIEIKQLHSKYKLDDQQEQLYFVFLLGIPYVSSHCSLIIANSKSAMTSRNYWNSGRTTAGIGFKSW